MKSRLSQFTNVHILNPAPSGGHLQYLYSSLFSGEKVLYNHIFTQGFALYMFYVRNYQMNLPNHAIDGLAALYLVQSSTGDL